ncbi:DUF2939 domain-containing protein [Acinetobacter defluvii]|uniref:DUF2939 domain-containing protein n=1 Tax=Acinetobacter defluvii TaxID=1871111 RepID=UPI003AF84D16
MNKKVLGAVIAIMTIIILIGGYFYASPYLALNSIRNAVKSGDSEKLSAYIDFDSVRQSFKSQMNAYVVKEMASEKTDGWEALGAMVASTMVDKMVDAVVTPEGMTLMLQGKNVKESLIGDSGDTTDSESKDKQLDYGTRYLSMNKFEVTLKNKDTGKELKVIMERNGLSWVIKKFVIPMDSDSVAKPEPTATETIAPEPIIEVAPVISEQHKPNFNHSGVQVGAILESCYHDPCSVAEVQGFKLKNTTPTESDIELTLLGGSKGFDAESVDWNTQQHTIQIHCSITKPTLQIEDQVTVIPLNASGVPGVLWSDAETYMQACHNYNGEMGEGIQKFGYNVQE